MVILEQFIFRRMIVFVTIICVAHTVFDVTWGEESGKVVTEGGRSPNSVVYHSVRLHSDPHRAFEMFTVNELLESWLTVAADVEPFVGGKYELFWQPEDRENNSTIGCQVTAVEQEKCISFEWKSPKQFKHFANRADPLTHVVVFFVPYGDSTEVHMIHSGWRSSAEWEEARQWQDKAWRVAFNALRIQINGD